MPKIKEISLKKYIRRYVLRSTRQKTYKRAWLNLTDKIEAFEQYYGQRIKTNGFTAQVMEAFVYFLRSSSKDYKLSTVRRFGQKVGEAIRKAHKDGYAVHFGFEDVRLPIEETYAIALSPSDIEALFYLKGISLEAHAVRERFVFACCCGMRYSDVSVIGGDNFSGNKIIRQTKKTRTPVEVPMHWMVREILTRNGGTLPPLKTEQSYNKMLKRLCKRAGITEKVLYEQTHGLRVIRKRIAKYNLVTSHTARRSFATNAYLSGIAPFRIMLITGHTTEQSFFKYIRIQRSENAKKLAKHPFFQGKKNENKFE